MRLRSALAAAAAVVLSACGAPASSIDYQEHSPKEPRLGASATVKFIALDERGLPAPGVVVHFTIQGGTAGASVDPEFATTDKQSGIASTQLVTSARVSSVVVVATVNEDKTGSEVKSAFSPPINFAGSVANARQFTFQCGSIAGEGGGGIHAIGAYDETRHLIAGVKLECTAHVGDHNGDGVADSVVSFLTEAGTIGPSATSLADVVGNAKVTYKTSLPFPKDVPPDRFTWTPVKDALHTGDYIAPLWMHPFDWKRNPVQDYALPPDQNEPRRTDPLTSTRQFNPRDNLVSMIAVTAGEEGYNDLNGNGIWDEGEPFDDLTEPFVDSNDNGTWDQDERFIDTNGNNSWDGKNLRYDSNTLIWVQEKIIWTGAPHQHDYEDVTTPVFRRVTPSPVVPHFGASQVSFILTDPWFNLPAQNDQGDGCQLPSSTGHNLIIPVPTLFNAGFRDTYPAGQLVSFFLQDGHDPFRVPTDVKWSDPSKFGAPLNFTIAFGCTFTASPNDGYKVLVETSVSGTVD